MGNTPISFATLSNFDLSLPVIATFPPFSTKSFAVAFPIPALPPVTRNVELCNIHLRLFFNTNLVRIYERILMIITAWIKQINYN